MHVILQCIFFQHFVLQILCLYMFMGLLPRVFEACSRVLFPGRRHGDVTEGRNKNENANNNDKNARNAGGDK